MDKGSMNLIWINNKKRFSWLFIGAVSLLTLLLLSFDYYWRTNETNLSRLF